MSALRERTPGRTAWARSVAAPVRSFLSNETGGAVAMVGAAILALAWANASGHSYESTWTTQLTVRLGGGELSATLRQWVNEGLMTFFFLVVGLEAKREFDLGELREHRRLAIPALAAFGGILVPILIFLAVNHGGHGSRGWGAAMSTDTAFAMGALALLTPRGATRMRVFLLTLAVVDDLCALLVIALVYSTHISLAALGVAAGLLVAIVLLRYLPAGRNVASVILATGFWGAMFKSGIDPVVSGLIIGLATSAYTPPREHLERATSLAREFREQPTPELARTAQQALRSAISRNERLQYELHPWTSYVIVPLFALANSGVHLTGPLLRSAVSSPITLGILGGYVLGKPIGVSAGTWLASRQRLRGVPSPISGPLVLAAGAFAGMGFTVSLLIASLAFRGRSLDEARLGALASVLVAPVLGRLILLAVRRLPTAVRARQISRTAEDILDLAVDVDPQRDHIRGSARAPVTLLEYGDFECPYCGQAESVIRALLAESGSDIRYVWRHLPLNDVHPRAQYAAEASEAAAAQGRFWEMYDRLLAPGAELSPRAIHAIAEEIGLDVERATLELQRHDHAGRVTEDVISADESGVSGTPTFFINGRRHYGVYDLEALKQATQAAKQRAQLTAAMPEPDHEPGEPEPSSV